VLVDIARGYSNISIELCELRGSLSVDTYGYPEPSPLIREGATTILYGVHSSEWKRTASLVDEDIVWSLWKHKAVFIDGSNLANYYEHKR
jgi:hypothetical protein